MQLFMYFFHGPEGAVSKNQIVIAIVIVTVKIIFFSW